MRLYRIARSAHTQDLTGEGARLHGGRWTPPGYTAEHAGLAALESLAHFGLPADATSLDHRLIAIDVPQPAVEAVLRIQAVPADPASAGRRWLDS